MRWAWSLNAASSVMGSAAAVVCSIYFGLIQTLLIGGALYLAALSFFEHRLHAKGSLAPGSCCRGFGRGTKLVNKRLKVCRCHQVEADFERRKLPQILVHLFGRHIGPCDEQLSGRRP